MTATFEIETPNRLDVAFAKFLSRRTRLEITDKLRFEKLVAYLSQQIRQGHTCIEIQTTDKAILLASGFGGEFPADGSSGNYPLIVESDRLYLHRYWAYENRLAENLRRLSKITVEAPQLAGLLDRYFPTANKQTDWQREAAEKACTHAFCIITGGPGTGKTTTVCKILAILQTMHGSTMTIALTAPTGKAAMRLQESVANSLAALDCPDELKRRMPQTAETLHRLLGSKPFSPFFKHHADHPLIYDCIVVDEASMVDIALMSKLADALKPGGKLILLGDRDQLSSVESGAVLADLIAGLPGNTVELKTSYRFDSGIKQFAEAINRQNPEKAWLIMQNDDESIKEVRRQACLAYIVNQRETYVSSVKSGADFPETYRIFNRFQVLCTNRHGPDGTIDLNLRIENTLFGERRQDSRSPWYAGRPVIITQNNPALHLYNGDIGLCLPDREFGGRLMVFFLRPDGSIKKHLPARLPDCETVFAMTVHKSQGSEFDEILIVLPETANPVLCKELLYTAITRAKSRIRFVGEKSVFDYAALKKIERVTGLIEKLKK